MKNLSVKKFINKEVATCAAQAAFFAAFKKNRHVTVTAVECVQKIELSIFLNIGEHYELPEDYPVSRTEEREYVLADEPEERYKVVSYYFEY